MATPSIVSDWRRLPGSARQYINNKTGEVLSRRQYDEKIGRLHQAGIKTNEAQARRNAATQGEAQLLKPARGRKSALKLGSDARLAEIQQRAEKKVQAEIRKRIAREQTKKTQVPEKLTLRNFKKGKKGRFFYVPLEFDAIRDFIETASDYPGAFGYTVGFTFVDSRKGTTGQATLFSLRAFNVDFDEDDFDEMEDFIDERSYIEAAKAMVYIALKKAVYEKHSSK